MVYSARTGNALIETPPYAAPCYAMRMKQHFLTLTHTSSRSEDAPHRLLPPATWALFPRLSHFLLESASNEVSFSRLDELAPCSRFVSNVQYGKKDQADVGDEEVLSVPGNKSNEALGQGDDSTEN
jgi:hypothetical protein